MSKRLAAYQIAAVCLLAASSAAAAEGKGFYVGAGVGQATSEVEAAGFDDSVFAYRVITGYSFWRFLGAELAYLDTSTAQDTIGPFEYRLGVSTLTASAVGTWPIGRWFSLSGKLGYAFYESDQTIRLGNLSVSKSSRDDNFAGSIAAAFHFGQRFSVRAEFEGVLLDDGKFDALSINGLYKF